MFGGTLMNSFWLTVAPYSGGGGSLVPQINVVTNGLANQVVGNDEGG